MFAYRFALQAGQVFAPEVNCSHLFQFLWGLEVRGIRPSMEVLCTVECLSLLPGMG